MESRAARNGRGFRRRGEAAGGRRGERSGRDAPPAPRGAGRGRGGGGVCGPPGPGLRAVPLPPPFAGLAEAQTAIMVFEVAKSLSYENLVHRKDLSADMTRMIDAGLAVSPQ